MVACAYGFGEINPGLVPLVPPAELKPVPGFKAPELAAGDVRGDEIEPDGLFISFAKLSAHDGGGAWVGAITLDTPLAISCGVD